jgi:hypothetical protein
MSNCGPKRGEVKLLSAMTLDTVCTFKDSGLGPIVFITANKGKKYEPRMVGYASGVLRFIQIDKLQDKEFLRIDMQHLMPLDETDSFRKEELTCGCFSSSGNNWAVGTSFGSIILGAQQKDLFKEPKGWVTTRIDGLMRTQDHSVTSLQMTAFNPNGMILASFSNGEVKLWTSYIPEDRLKKLQQKKDEERRSKRGQKGGSARQQAQLDLHEIGITKFDIADIFSMLDANVGFGVVDTAEDLKVSNFSLNIKGPHGNLLLLQQRKEVRVYSQLYGASSHELNPYGLHPDLNQAA